MIMRTKGAVTEQSIMLKQKEERAERRDDREERAPRREEEAKPEAAAE